MEANRINNKKSCLHRR